ESVLRLALSRVSNRPRLVNTALLPICSAAEEFQCTVPTLVIDPLVWRFAPAPEAASVLPSAISQVPAKSPSRHVTWPPKPCTPPASRAFEPLKTPASSTRLSAKKSPL